MVEAQQMLQDCRRIVVVDWPSREVPDALVLAGYSVVVKSGPGPAPRHGESRVDRQAPSPDRAI